MENQGMITRKEIQDRLPELKETLAKFSEVWKTFELQNESEFKKTLKTLKYIFTEKSLILPRDWKEVFWEWYIKKELSPKERAFLEFKNIQELLRDQKVILKWAKQYTASIEGEVFNPKPNQSDEKNESLAVRYKLLDEFFQGNENFKKLKIGDQEKLLGFILGCRADTAKNIKNNVGKALPDGKYITEEALARFTILFDKIKKGDIL